MTQTLDRRAAEPGQAPAPPPPHPHYTLGTLIVLGIVGTLVAVGLAVAALMITASRNSVDDELVSAKVDQYLGESGTAVSTGDVIPDFVPKADLPVATQVATSVAPSVPPPVARTTPAIVEVHFEVVEGVTTIDPETGVATETWGYRIMDGGDAVVSGTPGPMIRARVGDVLRFTITNPEGNTNPHNIDLHAVTGQGGGAADTTVVPGETKTIEARMLYPGFFLYHCAHGDVPAHIAHGMYGGILVEPEQPLPEVDHEWYMVQSEFYTDSTDTGTVEFDRQALTDENPTYVVFNGAVGSLTGDNALQMNVGERSRIYFVNAGPDLDSNFHPIGSHWDKVYPEAALLNAPLRGSQTTLVSAGGGTVVEIVGQVPQTVLLVDHAISRTFDKGALGQIVINGAENPEIFSAAANAPEESTATTAETGGTSGATEQVSMLPGASSAQNMNSPDEFSDTESPADYSVNVLRVPVGTTVTWTNTDPGMFHTVTAVDGSFDSGFLEEGGTFSYTFETAGEFEYFCTPHPWMRAKVIVEG
ncbi:MAG TPA: copper-containing nitrite reductase [Acidimicrobiia bacterium]|nr:copper-containing nitrite reductase [Acidimicrobiia bacterium]